MQPATAVLYLAIVVGGIALGVLVVRLFWRGIGLYRIYRAGPRPLVASEHRIWHDPGPVEQLDLIHGPGGAQGAPVPPFTYLEEHVTGSQPCVSVRDAHGRRWRVKWGPEVRSEAFGVRFAWACGYFAEVTHFMPSGRIENVRDLARARGCLDDAGTFVEARFELQDEHVHALFEEHSWAWNDNPFLGTRELAGLKIVVMLLSNWDTKDRRDVARGSNTAIFEHCVGRWRREARYLITDWGGSMGRWGSNIVTRGRWDAEAFEAQAPAFVSGIADGCVNFGYAGQRTVDIATGITIEHARWFVQRASGLREAQLRDALLASGATEDESERFTRAILQRIRHLRDTVGM